MLSPSPKVALSDDVIRGAGPIAELLYGDARHRRRVYHLAESKRLPHFKLGVIICARRSTILSWIQEQERTSVQEGEA